jgi:peptide-methionine (S)-S-oxide reductase
MGVEDAKLGVLVADRRGAISSTLDPDTRPRRKLVGNLIDERRDVRHLAIVHRLRGDTALATRLNRLLVMPGPSGVNRDERDLKMIYRDGSSENFDRDHEGTQRATFAAGCFWGVEAAFREVEGVAATRVGYAGGTIADPTYEQVCSDRTGHAEAVQVWFDPGVVSYGELLDTFWSIHDPTTRDRQGWDFGSEYRSAIFFHDAEQERLGIASRDERQNSLARPIVTEIVPASQFYDAEEYHQRYFEKHGGAFCATTVR